MKILQYSHLLYLSIYFLIITQSVIFFYSLFYNEIQENKFNSHL